MKWRVPEGSGPIRLDRFVAEAARISRAEASRLIDAGCVRAGGHRGKKGTFLEPGTTVELTRDPPSPETLRPTPQPELPLSLLIEDLLYLAANKPSGMPS